MENLPEVIDYELINELKRKGEKEKVKEILKNFHKDTKKSGLQARSDYDKKLRRVKKHFGVCIITHCNEKSLKDKGFCAKHYIQNRITGVRRYAERKEKGICQSCGKKAENKRSKCKECRLKHWRKIKL